jgi:hypothetical protein
MTYGTVLAYYARGGVDFKEVIHINLKNVNQRHINRKLDNVMC